MKLDLPAIPLWPRLRLCRSPLFHGTCIAHLDSIMAEDRLNIACPGIPCVSLTRALRKAQQFAENSMESISNSLGAAVIVLDGELLRRRYRVTPFRDQVWDSGGNWSHTEWGEPPCRHECEEAVWVPIQPLSAVSVGIFRFERNGWTWEAWHSRSPHQQLHLFSVAAA